tara:strand:+ start:63 stop:494 length:432 start_codon:yes stop_codon:yes gene_type:complete
MTRISTLASILLLGGIVLTPAQVKQDLIKKYTQPNKTITLPELDTTNYVKEQGKARTLVDNYLEQTENKQVSINESMNILEKLLKTKDHNERSRIFGTYAPQVVSSLIEKQCKIDIKTGKLNSALTALGVKHLRTGNFIDVKY